MSAAAGSSILITLPDGKTMTFPSGVTGGEIAASIGPGLAKAALILEVDGQEWDLFRPIEQDAKIRIITKKDPEALELIRHDAAHVLAMAVQALYPGTQVTIGPAIDDGFYYDFAREEPFTPEDLPKIEAKMHEIVKADLPTRREVWPRDKAIEHFKDIGETYKAELIESIPAGEDVSIYWHGDWHDLCRGPHFATTGKIGDAFKLTKIAGAYWRGDAKNAQLQRIYGTAWRDKKELDDYLHRLEEAEKRDHRKIGQRDGAFHLLARCRRRPAAVDAERHGDPPGTGIPGAAGRAQGRLHARRHAAHHQGSALSAFAPPALLQGRHVFAARYRRRELLPRPMNCPHHHMIYLATRHSYRELPLRIAEYGQDYRYEASGGLSGLMRVRGFCRTTRISIAATTRPRKSSSASCTCTPATTT